MIKGNTSSRSLPTNRGPWTQAGGKQFYFTDPRPDDIDAKTIAHALSNLCRFGGQCSRFYSVGEHRVNVSRLLPPTMALYGLLHDASEAYLVDIPNPIKQNPNMRWYRVIEDLVMDAVQVHFQLSDNPEAWAQVKSADMIMLSTEAHALMQPFAAPWDEMPDPIEGFEFQFYAPEEAEAVFLERLRELGVGV